MKHNYMLWAVALLMVSVSCGTKESPDSKLIIDPVIPVSKGAYKHVVIVGVDGGGAFFKDTPTPRCDEIFKNQATTYRSKTSYPTISAQCWGSLLHGVLPEFHGLTNQIAKTVAYPEDSPYPSIFRVVREAMPEAKLASIVDWNAINYGIIENNLGVVKDHGSDLAVTQKIVNYFTSEMPTLLFVQFDSGDSAGHSYGYGSKNHLAAISAIDALIGSVYDQLRLKNILDETLFIVTADHGGTPTKEDGSVGGNHGGDTDAERYVFLGVAGKTVANGTIEDAETRDVAAIAAYALGLECPETWTGHVPTGVFQGVTAGERKEMEIPGSETRKHQMEPTPELSVTRAVLDGHNVLVYLPFDGDTKDAFNEVTTVNTGNLYYYDAYYGQGVALDDGYVTLKDVSFGSKSFSIAFWMKTSGVTGDPAVISNKDWASGKNNGFILSLRGSYKDFRFNAGYNRSSRMDYSIPLPTDFNAGWMHVILTVDRENKKTRLYYDFAMEGDEGEIPDALANVSFDALDLNIGQDGTGAYKYKLSAQLDEFIITADVLEEDDIEALKAHYHVK